MPPWRPTRAGAATARPRPRSSRSVPCSAPRTQTFTSTPSTRRHAHPAAPGRLPRRGHLRSPAARGERARLHRSDRRPPAERPLPRLRPRKGRDRVNTALAFELPVALEAHEPPEARGLARDEVRLMVATRCDGAIAHATFRDLPEFLRAGDLLVINTSATLPAAVPARRDDA